MLSRIIHFFKKEYRTLNTVEISQKNLLDNFKYLSAFNRKIKIAPVLKSNAYGHGIVEVAKILDKSDAPFFCVDSLYEAYELLKAGIKTKVLIMGYTDPENFKVKKLPFSYAVFNTEMLEVLNKYQPRCGIHIFIDTGMHREGISTYELPEFLKILKQFPNLKIEGLMSHFASADDTKDPLNKQQIKNFKKALQICQKNGIKPKWFHIQNSDGLENLRQPIRNVNVNLVRTGLSIFGISKNPKLKPVLTLKSKIIQIKKLQKGDRVGYSGTYHAKKETTIGILPLGYYDGVDLRLSNKGFVTLDEIECQIIGRVSMNITTIDISKVENPHIGQEVIVYSPIPKSKNSVASTAQICNTIPYNILIHFAASTRRIII